MKTKQDPQTALKPFFSLRRWVGGWVGGGMSSEILIAALEIWLLVLQIAAETTTSWIVGQYALSAAPRLSAARLSFLRPIICCLLHRCHHHHHQMPLVISINPTSGELQSNASVLRDLCNSWSYLVTPLLCRNCSAFVHSGWRKQTYLMLCLHVWIHTIFKFGLIFCFIYAF